MIVAPIVLYKLTVAPQPSRWIARLTTRYRRAVPGHPQPKKPLAGAQVRGIGLLAVGFGSLDQAVKLSAGRRTFGRVAEQPVLASDHKGPDGAFGRVVVDRQVTFLDIPFKLVPIAR